jgi:hypothetical protein
MADDGRDRCNRISRHLAHVPFTASAAGIDFAAPVVRIDPVVMRSASLTQIPKAWSLTPAPESEAGFVRSGLAQEFEPAWLDSEHAPRLCVRGAAELRAVIHAIFAGLLTRLRLTQNGRRRGTDPA